MSSKLTDANLWKTSLLIVFFTVIIIFITEMDWFMKLLYNKEEDTHYMFWKFGLQNISFFLMGLATINLFWELSMKRDFSNEILEKVNLSTDIKDSGIIKIRKSFQKISQEDWDDLLKVNIKFLKLFFSSSTVWRRHHLKALEKLNFKQKTIEIYMPNFKNEELLKALSLKDNETPKEIKSKIKGTYDFFQKLQKQNSKLKIILVDEVPIMTFYMNNERIIIATYSLISKEEDVPTFIANSKGFLYQFANREIKHLKPSQSP
jgi:hypothetical protein